MPQRAALAEGPLYGYAIKDAVADESAGKLTPRPGSLYRVIARLITAGLVAKAKPAAEPLPHPGLARRYYGLTAAGLRALTAETHRIKGVAALAEKRLALRKGRS